MSVYVDYNQTCMPNKNWKYKYVCHMRADTLEELHEMALLIGLKKDWFQSMSRFPHYDLTPNKRRQAIKQGAIEKPSMELLKYFKRKLNVKKKKN